MLPGTPLPQATFKTRVRDESVGGDNPYRWQDVTTKELFAKKRVVLFSLPGAFTPTCSDYQLPSFEESYDEIRNLDIDEIYVVSVNDAFTMKHWLSSQGVQHIKAIPDGNAEFTRKMGMLVDKSNLGFGMRSWRYAAIVSDGKIEKWFEEPGICDLAEDDPYGVTSPESIRKYLESV